MTNESMSRQEIFKKILVIKKSESKIEYLQNIFRKEKLLKPETAQNVRRIIADIYLQDGEDLEKRGFFESAAMLYTKAGMNEKVKEDYMKEAEQSMKDGLFYYAAKMFEKAGMNEKAKEGYMKAGEIAEKRKGEFYQNQALESYLKTDTKKGYIKAAEIYKQKKEFTAAAEMYKTAEMVKMTKEIDKKFLEKNTRIRNALAIAGIKTYEALAKKDYKDMYYEMRHISKISLKKIQSHLIHKGYQGLKNYDEYSNRNLESISYGH